MTAKPPTVDLVESARKILNAPSPSLQDLEAAAAALDHVRADLDVEIAGMAARRREILAADGPAAEIDRSLEKHDEAVRALVRRSEVAAAISTKLAARIETDTEVERAHKQQATYDEALKLHVTATNLVREFLDKLGPECRKVMREYAESEMKTAAANRDLPHGAAPIPSIEAERKGELRSPKTTVREFKGFTDGRRFVGEQGHVLAAERADGRWDVQLAGGTTGAGDYFTCERVDFIEVTSETDATPWPEYLSTSLSCPAFSVTQPAGWRAIPADNLGPPDQILIELDRLQSLPAPQFPPRVETRIMPLANWRRMNGEVEPAPVAVAAE